MIRLLDRSEAAAKDAAIFAIAALTKWDLVGMQRSFARNQGGLHRQSLPNPMGGINFVICLVF